MTALPATLRQHADRIGGIAKTQTLIDVASVCREAAHELEQRDKAIARCVEALEACREYLDDRADAELDSAGYTGNEEMRLLVDVEAAIRKATVV